MTRRIENYILPAAWASAIVNNDYSGTEEEDRRAINTFLALNGLSFCSAFVDEHMGFVRVHDAFQHMPLAAECIKYQFIVEG